MRFFRDYSIADVLFMMMSALTLSYVSFSSSSATLRSSVCDELGRQPELLREVAESGLDLENCEYWFERGIVLMIALYMVFVVVKVRHGPRPIYHFGLIRLVIRSRCTLSSHLRSTTVSSAAQASATHRGAPPMKHK